MLDRVDMDVIGMPREIGLIADEVLPIPSLPYSSFALALPTFGTRLDVRQAA